MKRSPMKTGTKPLAHSAFKRKPTSAPATTGILRVQAQQRTAPAKKSAMKSKGPRMTPIRRAARGQDCMLQLDGVCNRDPATTVLCHSNYLADGKGMGLKAPDTAAAFGCSSCHDVLDGRRPRPPGFSMLDLEGAFYAAMKRTHAILHRMGLMISTTKSEAATGLQPDAASKQNHL